MFLSMSLISCFPWELAQTYLARYPLDILFIRCFLCRSFAFGNSLPIKLTLMTTQVASMIEMCFIFKLKLINLTLLGSFGVLNSTDASLSCGLLCVIRLLFRSNKKLLHVTSISLIGWYKEQESRTPDLLWRTVTAVVYLPWTNFSKTVSLHMPWCSDVWSIGWGDEVRQGSPSTSLTSQAIYQIYMHNNQVLQCMTLSVLRPRFSK